MTPDNETKLEAERPHTFRPAVLHAEAACSHRVTQWSDFRELSTLDSGPSLYCIVSAVWTANLGVIRVEP